MTDKLKEFLEYASRSEDVRNKINAIEAQDQASATEAIIALAAENGFEITKEDFVEEATELSEDELDTVAGGRYNGNHSDCFCAFGGGGTADQYQKACACVFAGTGELTDFGKSMISKGFSYEGSASAPVAMFCAVAGSGWKDIF